jgi:hypothetical protein
LLQKEIFMKTITLFSILLIATSAYAQSTGAHYAEPQLKGPGLQVAHWVTDPQTAAFKATMAKGDIDETYVLPGSPFNICGVVKYIPANVGDGYDVEIWDHFQMVKEIPNVVTLHAAESLVVTTCGTE